MWTVSQVGSQSENGSEGQSGDPLVELKLDVIDVTPSPIFAWFDRLHNRMFGGVKMPRRVLVLR
jgi:hypothetical protein